MTRLCAAILLAVPVVLGETRPQTVLLAAHRAGTVEVLDPITLQSLGSIKVLPLADGVTSDRSGILFLREGIAPEFQGCCALYAVDLKTREMTKLLEPVSQVTVSPDGQHVVTQRGNVGIEAFDVHTPESGILDPAFRCAGCLRFELLSRRTTLVWRHELSDTGSGRCRL